MARATHEYIMTSAPLSRHRSNRKTDMTCPKCLVEIVEGDSVVSKPSKTGTKTYHKICARLLNIIE